MKLLARLDRFFHWLTGCGWNCQPCPFDQKVETQKAGDTLVNNVDEFIECLRETSPPPRRRPYREPNAVTPSDVGVPNDVLVRGVDLSMFGPGDQKYPAPRSVVRDCVDLKEWLAELTPDDDTARPARSLKIEDLTPCAN